MIKKMGHSMSSHISDLSSNKCPDQTFRTINTKTNSFQLI